MIITIYGCIKLEAGKKVAVNVRGLIYATRLHEQKIRRERKEEFQYTLKNSFSKIFYWGTLKN